MRDPSLVRFRRVVQAATDELERRRQEVNDLNVFPVADGDTGDNMVLTLKAVLAELDRLGGEQGQRHVVARVAVGHREDVEVVHLLAARLELREGSLDYRTEPEEAGIGHGRVPGG